MNETGLEPARVLVEGGPVHRRLSRWLALLTGLMIGLGAGLGWIGVEALTATSEIQGSRHQRCVEGNERHARAKGFVDRLVAGAPKPSKPLTGKQQAAKDRQVRLFLEAIAPVYDCSRF